jgi:hypothetical protein
VWPQCKCGYEFQSAAAEARDLNDTFWRPPNIYPLQQIYFSLTFEDTETLIYFCFPFWGWGGSQKGKKRQTTALLAAVDLRVATSPPPLPPP